MKPLKSDFLGMVTIHVSDLISQLGSGEVAAGYHQAHPIFQGNARKW